MARHPQTNLVPIPSVFAARLDRITARRERACRVDQMARTPATWAWLLRWDAAYHDEQRWADTYGKIWDHLVVMDAQP